MKELTEPTDVQPQERSFDMTGIGPEAQERRGWSVDINQEVVDGPISEAAIKNERMGITFTYGMRPEGYDGVTIRERGGGGAVTMPYMVHPETGVMYVGLVQESRPTLGGTVWNVPRGFLDLGETHDEAAVRETKEETGYSAVASRIIKLATGLNPNSTYFDTSGTNDDGTPEGVSVYGIQVELDELEPTVDEEGGVSYAFPASTQSQAEGDKAAERIFATRFVPVTEAVRSRDMFTSAAAGQLLAHRLAGNEVQQMQEAGAIPPPPVDQL